MNPPMNQTPLLVDTGWLEAHLHDPALRIFDCSVRRWIDDAGVYRVARGDEDYREGHIPNAQLLDLVEDLSAPGSPLRFTLPTPERFARAVEALGVSDDSHVVLYGTGDVQYTTRAWWMFRVFGFDRVSVLDGGWQAWSAEGRPVTTDVPRISPGRFTPGYRPTLVAHRADVLAAMEDPGACLINALAPDIHAGTTHVHYGPAGATSRPGRIPGSVNLWALDLVDKATNRFLPLAQLQAKFAALGVAGAGSVITY